jgi:aspartate/methionine/tyrosine aminotransferase
MGPEHSNVCELVSLNSISKGFLGECGLRGGYMELHNLSPDFHQELVKLKSIFLCSNSIGQCMVEMMVNPPVKDVAQETKAEYLSEKKAIMDSLKKRANIVTTELNKMKNINCQKIEGAMYAFPSIFFSKKAIEGKTVLMQLPKAGQIFSIVWRC